jgi:urease accessory protein
MEARHIADSEPGTARVRFVHQRGFSRLAELYQHEPLRVLFPDPGGDPHPLAVLVNTAGGLVGGDRLSVSFDLEEGAAALVTSQAAEKVYRSTGREVHIDNHLRVGRGGWLEWLPQETLLFDGARLRRRILLERSPGARALCAEMLVLGRLARGERVAEGLVHDAWEVRCGGRLTWADALRLEGNPCALADHPAGWAGARACATLLYAADDAAEHLSLVRGLQGDDPDVSAGATVVGGVLVARFLSRVPQALRAVLTALWVELRARLGGLPRALPPLWSM